ncbi:MAG: cyclic nucleotide-binding domain-containing protein [Deltaproteobacteria bacterium]|nr:cyclic nucleotide-binding domain-containing protein [Deltaproteobacteria bacterium]
MVPTGTTRAAGLWKGKAREAIRNSLLETDFYCAKSLRDLLDLGLGREEALAALAGYRSEAKYGYRISSATLSHLLRLAGETGPDHALYHLTGSPVFLMKAAWLYEHAPFFFFYAAKNEGDLDAFITRFADEYQNQFLLNQLPTETWKKIEHPWRVIGVSFWENQIFDPLALVDKARRENLEGLELSVDFHPFNYRRILPEELSPLKRRQIREACARCGLKIDIHSPIVGPYTPFPDPKRGAQVFYNPLNCFDIQCETIRLARDIGAGSVVIHLIDPSQPERMAELVAVARGSDVRVTFENYCQTKEVQSAENFLASLDEISGRLPEELKVRNFGVTLDVGHLNIEGEDPLIGAEKIGLWCLAKKTWLRLHATDNYGKLLFSPPAYSADVHSNVSGRGINNKAVILMLRSMGHDFDVVAEQIQPLSHDDVLLIHEAQASSVAKTYRTFVRRGREGLTKTGFEPLFTASVLEQDPYLFLAGFAGTSALKEYLVLRKIQEQKYLYVEEAKKISQDFMRMPGKFRKDLIEYIDDLLLPVQGERGALQKTELDLICQNISGALFGTLNNEHLNLIFSETRLYGKGETICRQNVSGQEMYFIKEGEVTVLVDDTPLATLRPGEIFGEISLFYNVLRTATIRAATDEARIGVLTREGFEKLLQTSAPYTYDLIYRLYNTLPERLRNLNDKYRTAINALALLVGGDRERLARPRDLEVPPKPKGNFFPSITREEALTVFRELRHADRGQVLFAEGDVGEGAYMIVEGKVKVVTSSEQYDEITLGELGCGEIFGEMALIDDKPRSASIITITPCTLAFTDRENFQDYIQTGSELAFRFMAFICLSLFRRILTLDKNYADLKKALA